MRYFTLLFLLFSTTLAAQEFSAGFRAGLNFATFIGPSEVDTEGSDLENYTLASGFHVGGMANLKFTDQFTLRGELIYTQKGGNYEFNGPSFWVFDATDGSTLVAEGERSTLLSITNSYIDIPIMAVGRFGRFEVSGGASVGFLVSSRGSGELRFNGSTRRGTPVDPFTVALDFNYLQGRADTDEFNSQTVEGKNLLVPSSLSAYYQFADGGVNRYNTLEVGLIGGAAFFLNQGLFLGLRAQYGLTDVTSSESDVSRYQLDESDNYRPLSDDDRNLVLQVSVGFSF